MASAFCLSSGIFSQAEKPRPFFAILSFLSLPRLRDIKKCSIEERGPPRTCKVVGGNSCQLKRLLVSSLLGALRGFLIHEFGKASLCDTALISLKKSWLK
jgi:hypothetical protein